jgi:predicted HD phosphohydrolase
MRETEVMNPIDQISPTVPTSVPERASFTAMDVSTKEEWMRIGIETNNNQPRVAETVLGLLRSLAVIEDGFVTNQLVHCLQTATYAERSGATEEVIVAALCHDVGKAISVPNHPAIAAAILKPYVSDDVHFMVSAHQDFQGKHYYHHFGMDPDARSKYADHPAYELAAKFADEWDQKAFDPNGDTLPLEHFEPMVRRVFAKPRFITPK